MKKFFLLCSLTIFVVAGTPLPGLCDYDITCIDPNGMNPDINNLGHVVWVAPHPAAGGDWDIFLFDGSSTSQVTTNDTSDQSPRINDAGQIAWFGEGTVNPQKQPHIFNGATIEELTDDPWLKHNLSLNNQGKIAWEAMNPAGVPGDTEFEVFLYDGTVKQLTNNASGQSDFNPRINDSGQMVWQGQVGNALSDYEIFFYDNGTTLQLTGDSESQVDPDINGSGHLVWSSFDPGSGGTDIFFRDTFITNLTNDSAWDSRPLIDDNGHVVWLRENGAAADLWRYDGTGNALLASDVHTGFGFHHISNGYVTWVADDGGDTDIFVFDGTTTIQLTSDGSDDKYPRVNDNGAVVWQSDDNGVCLARPMMPAVYHPPTGTVDIPEVVIAGSAKVYSVLLQRLAGVPGYQFRLGKARKMAPTGNAVASFDPVTGILTITILTIDGKAQMWSVQLIRQPGGGYEFKLLKASKI